ncbi:dihydroorotate oxidase B, electron transfer subunit [Desulfatibacillum alkenivorans DSM 16219]|uniref:Dihydroorotate dehydrogenase B (NAD(+)), electron transfer subunit n=1 Tax=Desulfatibacillum alkenivorans DSM 16219 TaxID=1121393 RepID=A0A1M6IJW7_9BACT|nr:dihydroorotate dehydrogenase electron transfer subunit [Desulfatibacillum alkenivorans]SHJ34746.1 dihydroorotate oxidase B, electron transfer subunit [Desulfatibacillum alkenivorans DSM 16219]
MKLFDTTALVLENKEIQPGYFRMELAANDIACASAPGQFVMVSPGDSIQPLLRRPFCVHDVKEGADGKWILSILFVVIGEGTRILSRKAPGETVQVLGPLGKGFSLNTDTEECLLVAGGIGAAPMVFLARYLAQEFSPVSCKVLLGARTANDVLCRDVFEQIGLEVQAATEDGGLGAKGLVTALLDKALEGDSARQIFTCGPMPMLKAVAAMAREHNTPCQVSVEAAMACGMGACLGCALPKKEGQVKHLHACMDGPVLDAGLLWS